MALHDALTGQQRDRLQALLANDAMIDQSRLTWLRGFPISTSPASLHALLERLRYLRSRDLPEGLGQNLHPVRLTRFARECAVAPISSLKGFGYRRRIATLAAQMMELAVTITDAAIAMFERLTGLVFSRSRNRQDQNWGTGKARAGKVDSVVRRIDRHDAQGPRTGAGSVCSTRPGNRLAQAPGTKGRDCRVR